MKEKLSALLDGQLDEENTVSLIEALHEDPDLRQTWDRYCLVGDLLRGEDVPHQMDLASRVLDAMRAEPTVLAPQPRARLVRPSPWVSKLLPLAASVAGVALVGWLALTLSPAQPELTAQAGGEALPNAVEPVAVRDDAATLPQSGADLHREYLFAHQGLAGDGPIPGVLQYVRTVSDVRQDDGR